MVQVRDRKTVNYAEAGESDSDAEAPRSSRKPKGATSPKARSTPKLAPQRKRRAPTEGDGEAEGSTLLSIVKKHGTALTVAAKDWVQRYKENKPRGTAEVLTFLIQASGAAWMLAFLGTACGTDEVVGEEEVEELEADQLKQQLDERAQEGLEEPFKAKGAKNFRSNYLELWDKIVREAYHAEVLLDQYMLDKLINLVIALNTSVVRDFRRVATLTACQLVTSFIHVTRVLAEGRATAERQLAVEEKKRGGKGGSDRIAAFKRTVDRSHSHIKELATYSDSIFQAVCQHRDIADDIRATVVEGIGHWIKSHPSAFLSDQYLKYIAWALSDKDPSVRSAAAGALLALYSQRDNVGPLHDFTERFSTRFKELVYDVDEGVAVKGVQLLTALVRLEEIPASAVKEVYTLLGDESPSIRHAVAELVAGMLEEQGERALKQAQATTAAAAGKRQRRKSSEGAAAAQHSGEELQLAGLLHLMQLLANEAAAASGDAGQGADAMDTDDHRYKPLARDISAQVVDALFNRVGVLSDWALMVEWLKSGKASEAFGEAGSTNLVQALRQALIKATGGQLIAGQLDKKAKSKERGEAQAAARQDATLVLMKELPTLLKKLQTDPAQAAAIVGVIPELKLEIYSLKRQDKAFAGLVGTVKDVMFKHDDAQVATECARALTICAREGSDAVKDGALLSLRQCCEAAVKRLEAAVETLESLDETELGSAVEAYQEEGESEEHEALYNCRVALGRLQALQQLHSGAAALPAAYDALHKLLEAVSQGAPLTGPIAVGAMANMWLLLLWQIQALDAGKLHNCSRNPGHDALADLAEKFSRLEAQLESSLGSELEQVRQQACNVLCDLCHCLSGEKLGGGPLEDLGFTPSQPLLESLWRQCEEGDATEEEAARLAQAKQAAVSLAARLIVFGALPAPQRTWLASQLVSYYVGQKPEVTEAVKELCRLLKKSEPDCLPQVYLDAMKVSYQRVAAQLPEDGTDEDMLDQFVELSQRIVQSNAGFNTSLPVLTHVVTQGMLWALRGAPARLPFLQGVAVFISRVPAAQAQEAIQAIEGAKTVIRGAPASKEDAEYPWDLYFDFMGLLKDRLVKGAGPKSVLKREGATAGGGSAKKGKSAGRKISFRGQGSMFEGSDGEDKGQDEEQENQEPEAELEPDDDQPGPRHHPMQRAAAARGRQPQGASRGPAGGAAAEGSEGAWRQRNGRPQQQQQRQGTEEEDSEREDDIEEQTSEEEEEQGEEIDASMEVLPTEEQLPGMQTAGSRHRKPALKSIFEHEEDEQQDDDEGSDGDEEEEDLPDIRGRGRQPAVVDPQPLLQQGPQGEPEMADLESQEVAQARRKRRR
ncbi:hypothetical protein N2152v2_007043 [Parachlorella kessleri]